MKVIQAVLSALALLAGAAALAHPFPERPLRIVVPNPPGGTVDIVARVVADGMSQALGQPVLVEPRPGASTMVGTALVARAPADGHTIVMIGTAFAMNPLVRKVPYDADRDFVPVARLVAVPYVVAVRPGVPAHSIWELVALARTEGNHLSYASFGIGQLAGESLKRAAGLDLPFVPYQGGVQATMAVVAGHVDVLIAPLSDAMPHIAAGTLRALAVTTRARAAVLPDVPSLAEAGYPIDCGAWIGAAVPAGTPREIVEKLGSAMLDALDRPQAAAALHRLNVTAAPLSRAAFGDFIHQQAHEYDEVIRAAHLQIE